MYKENKENNSFQNSILKIFETCIFLSTDRTFMTDIQLKVSLVAVHKKALVVGGRI